LQTSERLSRLLLSSRAAHPAIAPRTRSYANASCSFRSPTAEEAHDEDLSRL